MRSVLCAVMVLATVPAFAVEDSVVRKLDTKNPGITAPGSDDSGPAQTVIRSADDLLTVVPDAASRKALEKQVDFTKEKLVVIAWRGSSSSAATANVSRCGKTVFFTVVTSDPALTDWRPHVAVFAVPFDMAVEAPR